MSTYTTVKEGVATHEAYGDWELDPETGLPLVQEDHFWRLVSGGQGSHFNHLQLRRWKTPTALMKLITKRRASVLVAEQPIRKAECSGIKVLDTSIYLLHYLEEERVAALVAATQVVPALGNYPSNKLEV